MMLFIALIVFYSMDLISGSSEKCKNNIVYLVPPVILPTS